MFIFIFNLLVKVIFSCHIYIPLCLYLYHPGFCRSSCHFPDLHSTMFIFIFFQQYPVHTAFPFTFHYVYIYIELIVSDNETIDIYIPLCLYLYCFDIGLIFFHNTFTFHYVYIYIRMSFGEVLFSYIYIPLCLYLYFSQCNHNQ